MLTAQCSSRCPTACAFSSNSRRAPAKIRSSRICLRPARLSRQRVAAGIELDWSDPDTLTGLFAAVLGVAVGIGAPLFYISRDNADDKKLGDLRELNRQNYKETGKYLTEVSPYSVQLLTLQLYVFSLPGAQYLQNCRRRSGQFDNPDGQIGGSSRMMIDWLSCNCPTTFFNSMATFSVEGVEAIPLDKPAKSYILCCAL